MRHRGFELYDLFRIQILRSQPVQINRMVHRLMAVSGRQDPAIISSITIVIDKYSISTFSIGFPYILCLIIS